MRHQIFQIETDDLEGESLRAEITATAGEINSYFEKTLVIFLHDFPYGHRHDHDDFYGAMRDVFEDRGFETLLFDFQGCGDSEGKEEEFTLEAARENFKRVLKWAKRWGYGKFIYVASGTSAALALEESNDRTKIVFLFWPAVDLAAYSRTLFYQADGRTVAAKGKRVGGDLIDQMASYNMGKALKTLPIPILIQYGAEDDIVKTSQIDVIKNGFGASRIDITSYADGQRGLTNPRHRQMVSHHIRAFLDKYA
jgi:pimeloyl-ACP methyl ester carboxylesterase